MSRTSQTEIAVLGALSVEPMTGYAIRAAITETLGHFWSESFGQIYPTLTRLEAQGFIEKAELGKTSGSVHRLTSSGRSRLIALLGNPIPATPLRNGILLRLFFGRLLGVHECREIVGEARLAAEATLAQLSDIRTEIESDADPNAPYWLMTVAAGQHTARAHIAWAVEAEAILDNAAS